MEDENSDDVHPLFGAAPPNSGALDPAGPDPAGANPAWPDAFWTSLPQGERESAAMRAMLDAVPHMVWSTRPDGYSDFYNQRWYRFTGAPAGSTDGEGWNGLFHPDDQPRALQVWYDSVATGEPYEIEYRLRHHSGDYRWVLGRALPVRDSAGQIVRWFGTCTDVDDFKRAEASIELIAGELAHRINNIFAVMISLLSATARYQPESAAFVNDVTAKVRALAKAHALVRPADGDVAARNNLQELLHALLAPYEIGAEPRFRLTGDDTGLGIQAAGAMALVVHELATNALKYGALSAPGGTVSLACTVSGTASGGELRLIWRETGGPPVTGPPQRSGFGTEMKQRAVLYQLRGTMAENWQREGLVVELAVPLEALRH
ncbi:MAG: hypothetical protein RLZZ08_479 [Pseudomonadota bacterium]|jgi:PAS domain S-box-containing protein